MFCGCELSFGEEPNTRTCPICLGHPGVAAGDQRGGRALRADDRDGARVRDRAAVDLPPQEVLLSRPTRRATRSPSTTSRSAARAGWGTCGSTAHIWRRTPRSWCTPARRAASTAPSTRSSTSTAAGRRWSRSSPSRTFMTPKEAARVAAAAARDAEAARRLRREHGGGVAALRRERVAPPRGRGDAGHEDRAEEHELVPVPRARDRGGDRAPGGDPARRRRGRAGDAPLRPAERAPRAAALEGGGARLPLLPRARPGAGRADRGDARARTRGAARAAGGARRAASSGARPARRDGASCWRSAPSWATSTRRRCRPTASTRRRSRTGSRRSYAPEAAERPSRGRRRAREARVDGE